MTRWLAVCGLVLLLRQPLSTPTPSSVPPRAGGGLGAAARMAILRTVCEGKLVKDRKGWVCKDPDESDEGSPYLAELRWGAAKEGRFVAGDGEWLVGLDGLCLQGCTGLSYVVRRSGTRWTKLAESEDRLHEACIVVRGMAGGLDGVVCEHAAGPHMGSMFTALDVVSFAGGTAAYRRLMEAAQGGECFLPTPAARSRGDILEELTAGDPRSDVAFTVLLLRASDPCDPESKEPSTIEGRHVLTFLKHDGTVVPDPKTAALIREHGWAPAR